MHTALVRKSLPVRWITVELQMKSRHPRYLHRHPRGRLRQREQYRHPEHGLPPPPLPANKISSDGTAMRVPESEIRSRRRSAANDHKHLLSSTHRLLHSYSILKFDGRQRSWFFSGGLALWATCIYPRVGALMYKNDTEGLRALDGTSCRDAASSLTHIPIIIAQVLGLSL